MLSRLARLATNRAHRTKTLKDIHRAWFLRCLASWLRGGDWSPMPVPESDDEARRSQRSRQERPKELVILEYGEGA